MNESSGVMQKLPGFCKSEVSKRPTERCGSWHE